MKRAKAVPMPLREAEEYSLRPAEKNYLNRVGLSSSSVAKFFLYARFMNYLMRLKTVSAVRVWEPRPALAPARAVGPVSKPS